MPVTWLLFVDDLRLGDLRVDDLRLFGLRVDDLRVDDLRVDDLRVDDLRVDDLLVGDLRVDDLRVDDLRVDDLPEPRPFLIPEIIISIILFRSSKFLYLRTLYPPRLSFLAYLLSSLIDLSSNFFLDRIIISDIIIFLLNKIFFI